MTKNEKKDIWEFQALVDTKFVLDFGKPLTKEEATEYLFSDWKDHVVSFELEHIKEVMDIG